MEKIDYKFDCSLSLQLLVKKLASQHILKYNR